MDFLLINLSHLGQFGHEKADGDMSSPSQLSRLEGQIDVVTLNMSMTHPWLQDGAGGITASLGTCLGCCAGHLCLFTGLVWSLGGSAE